MRPIVTRSVRLINPEDDPHLEQDSLSLIDFESDHGYVLIGEPGIGKTTEFNKEVRRVHAPPTVSARQFISRNLDNHPEWQQGPLFIDGLDEVRTEDGDPRGAMDKIIHRLESLGNPRFRISCRSIHWLGAGDRRELSTLSDSKEIPVLQLNPLGYHDIREIILGQEADEFIRQAYEHNMEGFLGNPQLLNVLLTSLKNGGWPDSPTKTFKHACRELIRERNCEHRDARSSKILPTHEAILSAAGQLFTLMLIANQSGWSIDDTQVPGILSLRDVEIQDPSALRAALNSGLFKGPPDCRTPIHLLLAEFLSGRYLAGHIQDELSRRRILALLTGPDGVPFPDLRGLTAWLATFNPQARTALIPVDPVAVAFNGDASVFSHEERKELLTHLEKRIELSCAWPSAAALGALAGHQSRSLVWKLTDSPERSDHRQQLVYALLRGISERHSNLPPHGKHPSGIQSKTDREHLLKIISDSSWDPDIRRQALRALNQMLIGSPNWAATLRKILVDLNENRLQDARNDLRGELLDILYSSELQPSEIWDYLVDGILPYGCNIYLKFWNRLADRSRKNQIKELLDSLCDHAFEIIPKLAKNRLADTVLTLLARGLDLCGDERSIPDLYRWFELIEFDFSTSKLIPIHSSDSAHNRRRDSKANEAIRNWLNERKSIRLALIEHELTAWESRTRNNGRKHLTGFKFVGKDAPVGFRLWCLTRAGEIWNSHPKAAENLAFWSVWKREGWEKPLSDDQVEQAVSGIPGLLEWNRNRIRARNHFERKESEWEKERAQSEKTFRTEKQKELEYLRKHKTELAAGNCSPVLLHDLATIYFDGYSAENDDPVRHLKSYLDNDRELLQAALTGFRSLLDRDDLPDIGEIAQLHQNKKRSLFSRPFLAGMEEENVNVLERLSEGGRRRAIGFYLVTGIPRRDSNNIFIINNHRRPPWYEQAIIHYPEAVADSMVFINRACVRAKFSPVQDLFKMAFDKQYAQIAPLAVRRMFSVFPTRCTKPQLESLRVILWSAILANGMSNEELQKIALARLNRKKMDIAQRTLWLCAGVYAARDQCLPLLPKFLSEGQESRLHRVLRFFVPDGQNFILQDKDDWSSKEMSQLIQAFGKQTQHPAFQYGPHLLSAKETSRNKFLSILTPWLQKLAQRDKDAVEALESLATDPCLTAWMPEITRVQEELGRRLRTAVRPELNLEKIQNALQCGPPANAADLTVLTTDTLEQLADQIQSGRHNLWRYYWHRDPKTNTPIKPLHENECRDILLSHLASELRKYQIDAQPEGQYAEKKRADIRVSFGADLAIPIEIKKNCHRDIWRGISEQLISNYTRDPEADGFGIYLVLWFGPGYMKKPIAPQERPPKRPEELKSLLEEHLDPPRSEKIRIVVIDVSPKGGSVDSG